jgi:UDP:flavonoid glycosyltransferase YjiC (YdhE family)
VRILVTSFPGRGHLNPVLPLAVAGRAAGHDVRVATGEDQCPHAASYGLDAVPVGPGLCDLIALGERRHGVAWGDRIFEDTWVREAVPALLSVADAWPPDIVVSEEEEYAGLLAATLLEIPAVTHSWPCPCRPILQRRRALERLRPTWADLAPGREPRQTGDVYLDACPPPLQSPEIADIPEVTPIRATSPPDLPGASGVGPDDLRHPAAYLTLGTVPVFSTPGRLRECIDALSPLVASLVVTTGPNPVASLGDLPSHVLAYDYLTQSRILPLVDLVVSHGGAGTTLGALQAGLPHLLLPYESQSQESSAEAVARLGAGLVVPVETRDVDEIRAAAARLLGEPAHREAAEAVRSTLSALPSPEAVVRRLVELVGGAD